MAAGLPSDEAPVGACYREASYSGGADMHILFKLVQNRQVRQKTKQFPRQVKLIIAAAFLSLILFTSCTMDLNGWMDIYFPEEGGAEVTLEWDPNNEPNLDGYRIYYGIESGNYSRVHDVGNNNISKISNLAHGVTYYFAATAYNVMDYESGFSMEIVYTVPNT
jgi:hypothetical protein